NINPVKNNLYNNLNLTGFKPFGPMRSRGVKKIFVGNPRLTIAQTNISFLFLNSFVYLKPYSTVTNIVDYFQHIQIYTDYFLPMGRILTIFNAIAKNEGISISALEK